jgi:hypothetical protein
MSTTLERPLVEPEVTEELQTTSEAPAPRRRKLALTASIAVLGVIAAATFLPSVISPTHPYDPNSATTKAFEAKTGIRIVRVAPTGGVGLVEIQFKIVDPSTAANLFGHTVYPTLIDEGTGRPLSNAFMGHSPHPSYRLGEQGSTVLNDPNHVIVSGALVTIVLGPYSLQHIPVAQD